MWLAKTTEDKIAAERARRWSSLWGTVGLWAVLLCLVAVAAVLSGRPPREWIWPVHGFLAGAGLHLAAIALIFGTVRWLGRSRANKPGAWICQKCNRVKLRDDQPICDCGGSFLALHEMKWVEDSPRAQDPPSQPPIAKLAPAALSARNG